jgi:osmotically-inducible protein OsmY
MKKQIGFVLVAAALAILPAGLTGCTTHSHTEETARSSANDQALAARIRTDLVHDPSVNSTELKVTALNGEVQLSGFVDSQAAKERAGQIATSTPGVVKVDNNLILPTGRY